MKHKVLISRIMLTLLLLLLPLVGTASAADEGPHPMNADPPPVDVPSGSAIISNGTVSLGVDSLGHLNFAGTGLLYLPTGGEVLWVGCLCEGWGAADATSGTQGWSSVAFGIFNVAPVSFASTASTATSVTTVGGILRVKHDYHPSPVTPFLYEIDVTIDNISGAPVDMRYTRDQDWDVPPTPFWEFVTIQGTAAEPTVLYADNNGFQTPGPLFGRGSLGAVGDFVDFGPADHGSLFDFGYGIVPVGASVKFTIFYGAAGTEAAALTALSAVGANVYSLGQYGGDPTGGTPNTFIFAYRSVLEVDIDIKPGSDPNSINPKSKGKIPVAILSSTTFDATTQVDKTSLTFGRTGDETSLAFCTKSDEDVNFDGLLDIVCHFHTRLTGFQVGDTEGILKGRTVGGVPIEGRDSVRIVK